MTLSKNTGWCPPIEFQLLSPLSARFPLRLASLHHRETWLATCQSSRSLLPYFPPPPSRWPPSQPRPSPLPLSPPPAFQSQPCLLPPSPAQFSRPQPFLAPASQRLASLAPLSPLRWT